MDAVLGDMSKTKIAAHPTPKTRARVAFQLTFVHARS
jgi:hypothetical protein